MRINFTKNIYRQMMLLALSFVLANPQLGAQCANFNTYYGDMTPAGVGPIFTETLNNVWGGDYYTIDVCEGAEYTIAMCGTSWDSQVTLYDELTGDFLLYSDDDCGNDAYLNFVVNYTGTIEIVVNVYDCATNSVNGTLSVTQETACPVLGGCANNNTYYGDMTPAGVGAFYTETLTNVWGGDMYTLDVCAGAEYTIAMCGTSWDSQITLYDELSGDFILYSDDDCGDDATLNFISNYTGTIEIVVDIYNCATNSTNGTLSVTQETACAVDPCPNNNTYYGDMTPAGVGAFYTETLTNVWGGDYYTLEVCEGGEYTIAMCGTPWDSQITLYDELTGDFLLYSDDDCGDDATLNFISNYSGTIEIVIDVYDCATNSTNGTLNVTQNGACIGGCEFTEVFYDYIGCAGTDEEVDFYPYFNGACTVDYMWIDAGLGWELIDLTGQNITSGDPVGIFLFLDNTEYLYYFELSDGTLSDIYSYTTGSCDFLGCEFTTVLTDDLGCDGDVQAVDFFAFYTGDCTVTSFWASVDGGVWEELPLTGTFESGDLIGLFLNVSNAEYAYYFELSDGTTSDIYYFYTDDCDGGCNVTGVFTDDNGCVGDVQDVDFFVEFTGACTVTSMWSSVDGGAWEELVLTGTFESGDAIGILLNISDATYQYYFELSDGTFSDTYVFFTDDCDGADCTNLQIDYTDTGCYETAGGNVPSGDITPIYNGACTVAGIYTSVDGGAWEYLDLSAYGFGSGDDIGLLFNIPDALYEVYYVLDDGSESPSEFFVTEICETGETICDCAGNQLPIEALAWLGDGTLDEGEFEWNGIPVDFNCATWGFDCGDELPDGYIAYDPYGTCSGSLPPANGCVDEFCYSVDIDVYTDCYPGEVSVYVYNENGDLVMEVPMGTYQVEEDLTTINLCLPAGCYTFAIMDDFGDGLAGADCNIIGYFAVYDYSTASYAFIVDGDAYTTVYSEEYCVGPVTECDNLEMELIPNDCYAFGDDLLPSVNMEFNFTGNCTVETVYISADGGDFEPIDVLANNWGDGDMGTLFYLQPNTDYEFYYVTDDGAASFLYAYTTDDCSNEITICDCDGTQLSIGVTSWLGDGFADNGFYEWAGEPVNFNCATWGYDCGDVDGAPNIDPYNVCDGQLPPFNGCIEDELILGCTDPNAINYDPQADINDGSCIYDISVGCMDEDACNYNALAVIDDGSCEYVTCAGCTDEDATNYDPNATIDDGSCNFEEIEGCTDEEALNYNPIATQDDGSCIFDCIWPGVVYDDHCVEGDLDNFYIDVDVQSLGNGAPYTITNTYNNQQIVTNLLGEITMGPFPVGTQVVVQVTSNAIDCMLTSQPLTEDCSQGGVYGCTDPTAINYNAAATIDDGSCIYIGVEEIETNNFALYPNPANDVITLSSQRGAESVAIRILDSSGRVVLNTQANFIGATQLAINVAALAQGNYVVEIAGDKHLQHLPLLIQR